MVDLYDAPNRYARRPWIEQGDFLKVHGYQEYAASSQGLSPLPEDVQLHQKMALLRPLFQQHFLRDKTILDLGANGGFFSFWALQQGATAATAVDMDADYVQLLQEARRGLGANQLRVLHQRVQDCTEEGDITLAFAMVHWLYSCTASYGSLPAVIAKLASLTRLVLVLEWIPPSDPAIHSFRHTQWNPEAIRGPYSSEAFEEALLEHFPKVEMVGWTTPSRKLYVCWKVVNEITLDPSLPLLRPADTVLSSRCIGPSETPPCYSRLYQGEDPDTVLKQTTGQLALREAQILMSLEGRGFPRVFRAQAAPDYSWFVMERIAGPLLPEAAATIRATPRTMAEFIGGCLDLIARLQVHGVEHRDIRPENLLLRDGHPVLIDFGWARHVGEVAPTPAGLGDRGRPSDGSFCDVYSMGVLIRELCPTSTGPFEPLVEAMTRAEASQRVTSVPQLKEILSTLELPAQWFPPPRWGIPIREWAPKPPAAPPATFESQAVQTNGSPSDQNLIRQQLHALRGVLAIDPDHEPSLLRLATLLRQTGEVQECLKILDRLRSRPSVAQEVSRLPSLAHGPEGHPKQATAPDLPPAQLARQGHCNLCGNMVTFRLTNPDNARESWVCSQCGGTSRDRMYLHALGQALGYREPVSRWPADPTFRILETCGQRAHPRLLQSRFDYWNTTYDPEAMRQPGWDRRRFADLQALHHPDESFDVVMHSEVFEHVRLHKLALAEIFRVLRPGGAMVLTVPFVPSMTQNLIRVQPEGDRDVHLLPPEYHDDHTLVYRVYGREFVHEMEAVGFQVDVLEFQDLAQAITAQNAVIARKPGPPRRPKAGAAEAASTPDKRRTTAPLRVAPEISIVIPVFNKLDYTRRCLHAIERTSPHGCYEVIVFDNASTDGTAEFLGSYAVLHPQVKVITHHANLGFVGANNAATRSARGRYLLFLNNDTEPQPGWFEALLNTIKQYPGAGAVGAKLVYPDGRLQEAGGIIFRDGSGWNYGRGQDPAEPPYNFVREVDYCSAACLLVPRDLFSQLGAFDERYAPAYYEDTDLCFRLRQAGYRVIYQPRAVVVHHEGATAGTELTSGYKRYQATNRSKFCEKWAVALEDQAPPARRVVRRASNRRAGLRILVIDPMMPTYDRASGSRRLFEMLRLMAAQGHTVTFIARNGQAEERYSHELRQIGIEVYAGDPERMKECGCRDPGRPLDLRRLLEESDFDLAILSFWYVGEQYLRWIRRCSPRTRVILDTVDVHFVREFREAQLAGDPVRSAQARRNKLRELAVYHHADNLITVTEQDRQAILTELPGVRSWIVPNIHATATEVPGPEARRGILFIGNYRHPPNLDAVLYFHREVFPILRSRLPGLRWTIAGNAPPPEIEALAAPDIAVTGFVPDVEPLLRTHRVSIAPLRYGAGMKGKIGEALAAGLPVVTTSVGAEGMLSEQGDTLLVADEPSDFAEAVVRLCEDDDLWTRLSRNGRSHVEDCYSPAAVDRQLRALLNRPLVSVVILTCNQLEVTRRCLESLCRNATVSLEMIVVDNGSTDGTVGYLKEFAQQRSEVRLVLNSTNRGYAAGNNQGLALSRGDFVVLLNNDTLVTPGWLEGILAVFRQHPQVGLAGPMTDRASGPQVVESAAGDIDRDLDGFAERWTNEHAGQSEPSQRLVGFCLALRRSVVEQIGGLDERFGSGNFEDDDYCLRAAFSGFQSRVVRSVFIHHLGGQTFKGEGIDYQASMQRNWGLFREKWNLPEAALREGGYSSPTKLPGGLELFQPLPCVGEDHASHHGGRLWEERPVLKKAAPQPIPEVATRGTLEGTNAALAGSRRPEAWNLASQALALRPFHPEAWLFLGEVARAEGATGVARQAAERARKLAPGCKAAKKFLKTLPKGSGKTPDWMLLPDFRASNSEPRLTVCLITKNEEKFLGQCLDSVQAVAWQTVVVDTGSTDRTVEIAQQHGAEVHTFEWCDDFAAARNAALEHARGDWVLMLDADEELAADSVTQLRRELREQRALAYRLPIVDAGRESAGAHHVPRLFRNAPGVFFQGRIHEHAFASLEPRQRGWGLEIRIGRTVLRHHGYTRETTAERGKVERNLRLLRLALADTPDDVNLRMNLGLELTRAGQTDAGLEAYEAAFRLAEANAANVSPELRETLLTQISSRLMAAGRPREVVARLLSRLGREKPLTATLHYLHGLALMGTEQWTDAATAFEACLRLRGQPTLTPEFDEVRTVAPRHSLAVCLGRGGKTREAEAAFQSAREEDPAAPGVVISHAQFLAEQQRLVEALELLHGALPQFPAEAALWRAGAQIALQHRELLEFADDWTREALRHHANNPEIAGQRAEALLLGGHAEAALPMWRALADHGNPSSVAALILCELCTDQPGVHALNGNTDPVTRQFLQWYQKLAHLGTHGPLVQINGRLPQLRSVLPGAAQALETAMTEADRMEMKNAE